MGGRAARGSIPWSSRLGATPALHLLRAPASSAARRKTARVSTRAPLKEVVHFGEPPPDNTKSPNRLFFHAQNPIPLMLVKPSICAFNKYMSTPNTEPKPTNHETSLAERVLAANLSVVRTFSPIGEQAFTTLYLVDGGRMATQTTFEKPENGEMLSMLYRETGADLSRREVVEQTPSDPDTPRKYTDRYVETVKTPISDTDYFLECYAREGDWQSFFVRLVHDARQTEQAA